MSFSPKQFFSATFVTVAAVLPVEADETTPAERAEQLVAAVAAHWKASGWGAEGSEPYMRPLDDEGWKIRMQALQGLVQLGEAAGPALTKALQSDNPELQIFAAQTFGYLPEIASSAVLVEEVKTNENPAVRLYSVDALAMQGGVEHRELFEWQSEVEQNRDVKMHLGYALSREGQPVDPVVIETLKNWDPKKSGTAEIGKPAPDFTLQSLTGEAIRLSQFRGKSPVVLVFVYGDT